MKITIDITPEELTKIIMRGVRPLALAMGI